MSKTSYCGHRDSSDRQRWLREAVGWNPRNRRELSGIAAPTNEFPNPSTIRSLARHLSRQGVAQIVSHGAKSNSNKLSADHASKRLYATCLWSSPTQTAHLFLR